MKIKLLLGDCLERMKDIPDQSVDCIIVDPPYGVEQTSLSWDSRPLPFDQIWTQVHRICKPLWTYVSFGLDPFTSLLITSNIEEFKYRLVWEKTRPSGFLVAKHTPLRIHEDIVIFSSGSCANGSKRNMTYNPQGIQASGRIVNRSGSLGNARINRPSHKDQIIREYENYPLSIVRFANPNNKSLHPTQKPIALMEYLVSTYTNPGQTVLDFCMGSGRTGIACVNLDRNFIGIEIDQTHFSVAVQQIKKYFHMKANLAEGMDDNAI